MNSRNQQVVTVRFPAELYEAIRAYAHAERTSMNKLIIETMTDKVGFQQVRSSTIDEKEMAVA